MQQLCAHAHGSPEIPTSAARSASSAGSSRSIASSTRARNTAWVIAFPIAATLAARSARARTQAPARDGRCGPGARNFRAGRHTARGTSSRQASIGTEIHLSVAWRGFGPPAGYYVGTTLPLGRHGLSVSRSRFEGEDTRHTLSVTWRWSLAVAPWDLSAAP